MYVYVYIYINTHVCMYVHTYVYIYIYTHTHICIALKQTACRASFDADDDSLSTMSYRRPRIWTTTLQPPSYAAAASAVVSDLFMAVTV